MQGFRGELKAISVELFASVAAYGRLLSCRRAERPAAAVREAARILKPVPKSASRTAKAPTPPPSVSAGGAFGSRGPSGSLTPRHHGAPPREVEGSAAARSPAVDLATATTPPAASCAADSSPGNELITTLHEQQHGGSQAKHDQQHATDIFNQRPKEQQTATHGQQTEESVATAAAGAVGVNVSPHSFPRRDPANAYFQQQQPLSFLKGTAILQHSGIAAQTASAEAAPSAAAAAAGPALAPPLDSSAVRPLEGAERLQQATSVLFSCRGKTLSHAASVAAEAAAAAAAAANAFRVLEQHERQRALQRQQLLPTPRRSSSSSSSYCCRCPPRLSRIMQGAQLQQPPRSRTRLRSNSSSCYGEGPCSYAYGILQAAHFGKGDDDTEDSAAAGAAAAAALSAAAAGPAAAVAKALVAAAPVIEAAARAAAAADTLQKSAAAENAEAAATSSLRPTSRAYIAS
ncbi:uncharacterized protein LOC113147581 [Cyclospora cayetanensis]|uniref:Uncharacterized protein LOC113147581 n=1 Tax=Cyclospora cayetanensis TaxID=88456 RepID=A0A6P6S3U3_9EIME|nr:uncharacterized protein LOC113147581 [Cyclospora cayetanensis]